MLLLVCKSPPEDIAVREWTDMALMAAMFQQQPVLLLLGSGVGNLTAPDSGLSDLAGLLAEPCRVDATALPDDGPTHDAALDYQRLDTAGIRQLYARARQVVTL
jgi:hypothetical protein